MRLIDRYVDSMDKFGAVGMELRGDKPIALFFDDGTSRVANASLTPKQVVQIIQECAPPAALSGLKTHRKGAFTLESASGKALRMAVDTDSAGQWMVRVDLEGAAAPASPPSPAASAPAVAAPAPAPAKPAAAAKRPVAEASADEPKLNQFLRVLVRDDGSDLHMCCGTTPMYRVSGEIGPLSKGHPELTPEQLSSWMREIASEEAWEQFTSHNDADFAYEIKGVGRFRMNYFMDRKGPGLVARQIPFEILSAKKLGIPEKVLDLCWLTKGLVLVTGPTGSGKSTTLASLVDYINDNRNDHIITIEDPIEFVHPNKRCLVNQREVGLHTGSFKKALRAALREDPDIVLVGEMRDLETISIAVETAETGHLVFGTLHTTTAASTVDRIIDQFPADQQSQIRTMLSESLRGVISQTLCKKKGGGRVAAYEILFGTSAVANLIREGKTFQIKSVMQTGRNIGMQTLNEHLMELVRQGLVEPKEAYVKAVEKQALRDQLTKAGFKIDLAENDAA